MNTRLRLAVCLFFSQSLYLTNLAQVPDTTYYGFLDWFFADSLHMIDTAEGSDSYHMQREAMMWKPRLHPYGTYSIPGTAMSDYAREFIDNQIPYSFSTTTSSGVDPNWRMIGPIGQGDYLGTDGIGRIHRIAFHPKYGEEPSIGGNQTLFAVSSFGGLWRSLDNGQNWTHLNTDTQLPFINVSDVVVNPNNENIIYLSTGIADERAGAQHTLMNNNITPNFFSGNDGGDNAMVCHGVYRSLDAGQTWQNISVNSQFPGGSLDLLDLFKGGGTIRKMILRQGTYGNELFLASSKGILRGQFVDLNSSPPGSHIAHWTKLPIAVSDEDAREFRGLALNPGNPNVIYASGKDIFRSEDGGDTWSSLTAAPHTGLDWANLPVINPQDFVVMRINIAVAPTDENRLYAYIIGVEHGVVIGDDSYNRRVALIYEFNNDPNGGIWRPRHFVTDAVSGPAIANDRISPRRMAIAVSPTNEDEVYFGTTTVWGTNDIQQSTITQSNFTERSFYNNFNVHADIHDLKFPPAWSTTGLRLWAGTDGGVSLKNISNTGRGGWDARSSGLEVAKIWTFDDSEFDPYVTLTGLQDIAVMGTTEGQSSEQYEWELIGGGDGYGARIDDRRGQSGYIQTNSIFERVDLIPNFPQTAENCMPEDIDGSSTFTLERVPNTYQMQNHPHNDDMYFTLTEIFRRTQETIPNPCDWEDLWEPVSKVAEAQTNLNLRYQRLFTEMAIAPSNPDYIYLALSGAENDLIRVDGGGNLNTNRINPYMFLIRPSEYDSPNPTDNVINLNQELRLALQLPIPNQPGELFFPVITDIAVDPKDHERVWISFSGYEPTAKVWYSEDAGQTWQNADPNGELANLPVNAIEYLDGSDDCLFIGTDAGVYVKENPTTSWHKYGFGFPNVRVTELKINYCVGRIRVATYGRGLWEGEIDIPAFLNTERIIPAPTAANPDHEIWADDRNLTGNLRIESGAVLTLTGTLNMPVNGRILVERGGKLVIDGGVITNRCGKTWYGIEVYGDPTKVHPSHGGVLSIPPPPLPQLHPNHGAIILKNGALLEHAQNAVTLVRKTPSYNDLSNSGGIIIASQSTFRNNRRSIEFMQFRPTSAGGSSDDNVSLISDCLFEHTPETQIPHDNIAPFITLWNTEGVEIKGNTFQNTDPGSFANEERGIGIYSIDAGYTVGAFCTSTAQNPTPPVPTCVQYQGNVFQNLHIGVQPTSSMALADPITIDRNQFDNNNYGSYLVGLHSNILYSRNIHTTHTTPSTGSLLSFSTGTAFSGSNGFIFSENSYHYGGIGFGLGAISNESGTTNHEAYLNSFEDLAMGFLAFEDNSGLQVKCNDFSSIAYYNIYNDGTNLPNQGFCQNIVSAPDYFSAPAGNRINDGLCISTSMDHLFVDNTLTGFDYSHHTGTDYTPQCVSSNVALFPCTSPHTAESCPSKLEELNEGDNPITQLIQYLNQELATEPSEPAYLSYLNTQRDIATQRLLFHYAYQDNPIQAISHLQSDTSMFAKSMVIPYLIQQGDHTAATELLNQFPRLTDEQNAFYDLHTWINTISSEGRTYFDMTSEEEASLRQIAGTETPYAYNALAILRLVFDEEIPLDFEIPDPEQARRADLTVNKEHFFSMYPNPAKGKLVIECMLHEQESSTKVQLLDLFGHELLSEKLDDPEETQYIDILSYPSGMYIVQLIVKGKIVQSEKLIIQR
ncbi:MAG: T9SS type A sorting domain-containing protein [Bacteroidota bacterium]